METKESKNELIIGVLIGSVAGAALGALVTNFANRFASRVWVKPTPRKRVDEVDPRWLLQ